MEREWGNTTTDFYSSLGKTCMMPASISKDDIVGRKDSFHCENI